MRRASAVGVRTARTARPPKIGYRTGVPPPRNRTRVQEIDGSALSLDWGIPDKVDDVPSPSREIRPPLATEPRRTPGPTALPARFRMSLPEVTPAATTTLPRVRLKIARRSSHPWIFQKMVEKPPTRLPPGSVVDVEDRDGQWV